MKQPNTHTFFYIALSLVLFTALFAYLYIKFSDFEKVNTDIFIPEQKAEDPMFINNPNAKM